MRHLPKLPLLEFLRPPPGWRTDLAILSAYSAEPAVLAALLLALAGRGDDKSSGSRVALAYALDSLKDRVKFLLQRGRIAAPKKNPNNVLALLDHYVREVCWDEGSKVGADGRSWHAKLALVRMVQSDNSDGQALWRFWLGSRNFTRDISWDIGLSLESNISKTPSGQRIPGIEQVARRLAKQAEVVSAWKPVFTELAENRWNVPQGIKVREINLMLPDDHERDLPKPPPDLKKLFAVAPFLDGNIVRQLGNWPSQTRTLLSTITALGQLIDQKNKPLEKFNELLTLPYTPEEGETTSEEETDTLDASLDAYGLHAKFLWAERVDGASLWLGSPNFTKRAWQRNAEAFAEIWINFSGDSQDANSLCEGLNTFKNMARTVNLDELKKTELIDPDQKAFEMACNQVAVRLSGRQKHCADGKTIIETHGKPPHPDCPRISLDIGRLGGPMILWPRETCSVILSETSGGTDSDLVSVRVCLSDDLERSWTQRVPFEPSLPRDRDKTLLRDYLGARGILSWIRDVLEGGIEEDGGGSWDVEIKARPADHTSQGLTGIDLPTVEQVLKAWVRDPGRLHTVGQILNAVESNIAKTEDDEKAHAHLKAFLNSWKTLRKELLEDRNNVH